MDPPAIKKSKSIPQRLTHAWEPLKGSFSVVSFGVVGVGEAFAWLFGLHEKLHKWGLWADWAPAVNIIFLAAVFLFFARAVFLLAEEAGEMKESLTAANKTNGQYVEAIGAIRDIIYDTRDTMLRDEGFMHLVGLSGEDAINHLYSIVERQMARIQHGMRSLTDSHCNVCLKVIKPKALGERDGLVTVCYGPAVPIERREKSVVLPVNQGIAAEALITKDIAFSNDISNDDRFWPRERRGEYAPVYRTVLCSPVMVNNLVRGVLCFDWAQAQMYDSTKHRSAVAAFTDVVSTAFYISIQSNDLVTRKVPER